MNLEKKERVGSIWVNAKSHHGAVRVKIVSTCWTKKSKGKSRRSSEEEEGGGGRSFLGWEDKEHFDLFTSRDAPDDSSEENISMKNKVSSSIHALMKLNPLPSPSLSLPA